jgi:hypothetical protein
VEFFADMLKTERLQEAIDLWSTAHPDRVRLNTLCNAPSNRPVAIRSERPASRRRMCSYRIYFTRNVGLSSGRVLRRS